MPRVAEPPGNHCNQIDIERDDDHYGYNYDGANGIKRSRKKHSVGYVGQDSVSSRQVSDDQKGCSLATTLVFCIACFLVGSTIQHASGGIDSNSLVEGALSNQLLGTTLQKLNISLTSDATTANALASTTDEMPVAAQETQVEEEEEDQEEASFQIDYPESVKTVVINVGSNLDPILPHDMFGPCARSIAVEPVVGCEIPKHPQLDVLPSAIADKGGLASLKLYNYNGESSSFANPAEESWWNSEKTRGDGTSLLVPVVSLKTLLRSIPSHINIAYLKTDMQGFDFLSIKSAGKTLLERVAIVQTETWVEDSYTYDAKNDLCRDWLPYMTNLGYRVINSDCGRTPESIEQECKFQLQQRPVRPTVAESPGLKECDIFWGRKENPPPSSSWGDLIKRFSADPSFTTEQYATCT